MNKRYIPFVIFCLLFANSRSIGQPIPKSEFRGAWIATVVNLDWPSSPGLSPESQRAELTRLLDELKETGINAVIFQVRPECDALYDSSLEPWSYWLTGQQGTPPSPFYDPLEFAIDEAHKRGMELHAWFNPYRAERSVGTFAIHPSHVTREHPDWIISIADIKVLNPGLPQVREYVTAVIMDVVNRYDVDGVHFDDYFYPYPPNQISNQDNETFQNHPRGFTNIGDWRRDNINLLIAMVQDSINSIKAHVKFGISPFGIWKNGVPTGIVGLDAYSVIYADAVAWLNQRIIDYLTPQLYWPFGGGQDYGKLQPWWSFQMNGRHLYIGHAPFRIPGWDADELPRQIRLNRVNPNVQGSVLFRALSLRENFKGFTDSLKTDLYRYPALTPTMPWKELTPPSAPLALRYERLGGTGPAALSWDPPADPDARRYAVYRFEDAVVQPEDYGDPQHIVALAGQPFVIPPTPQNIAGPYFYAVTTLDANSNESAPSDLIAVTRAAVPVLALPMDGASDQPDTVRFVWEHPSLAAAFGFQLSQDSTFAGDLIADAAGLVDTNFAVTDLSGQEVYYWRVNSSNAGGTSEFSSPNRFKTAFPPIPLLASPANGTADVSVNPTLAWEPALSATTYRLQFARSPRFGSLSTLIDTSGVADTSFAISDLAPNTFYYWRLKASNEFGTSDWSSVWRFKTEPVTEVADREAVPNRFALDQNYPNPFNPITTIAFEVPHEGQAELVVFDLLGRKVLELVDGRVAAGRHVVVFDASELPSGVYIYRLRFESQVKSRRMAVVK